MNNYYTLKHLVKEVSVPITQTTFSFAVTPRKNVIELYLECPMKRYRIITDTGSKETVFFLDEYRPQKKSNVYNPFESLKNVKIAKIELADRDRYISLIFENGNQLVFTLYGPHANVFHVSGGQVLEAFKNNDQLKGQKAPLPRTAELWNDYLPNDKVKRKITRMNPLFPRELIPSVISIYNLSEKSDSYIEKVIRDLTNELSHNPSPRTLINGDICLLSEEKLPVQTLKKFDDVNSCVRFSYYHALSRSSFDQSKEKLQSQFEDLLGSLHKQINDLEQVDKNISRAERYEKYGHLIMANVYQKKYDHVDELKIPDLYDNNTLVTITLDPELNLAENAQYYYEKSKKARKSYEMGLKRLDEVKNKRSDVKKLYEDFKTCNNNRDLQKWIKNHKKELEGINIISNKAVKQIQYPFRKTEIDGVEIWIGKNAKSNDKLTSMAHKEDIWMHARGVSGSHVVIRMENDKGYPQKDLLQKAASIAAYYSKAKGSKMAPVSYTKRKYVRKPKGAAPGLVILDREEVIMVEPQKIPKVKD